jgi:hypothetical protein
MSTLDHESIHAMREIGMITPEEWKNLTAVAKAKDWIKLFNIESRYDSEKPKMAYDPKDPAVVKKYEDFEDLNRIELFQTHKYPDKPEVIKSSKSKDAVLYQGYYYNFLRLNEMDEFISSNPTASFSKQWDKKVIELSLKYSEK